LENKEFAGLVEKYWRECNTSGWVAYVLKEKLKGLKATVKVWHRETYGRGDEKIEKLISDICVLDLKGEVVGLSEAEVKCRKSLFEEMWHLKKSKE
jgi:hypothetical protein